jgi:uncharacterized protein (TIGR02996 family)
MLGLDAVTYEGLLTAVCDDPTDPLRKLVLADWFEERGDMLRAEAWRELRDKCPAMDPSVNIEAEDHHSYWWYGGNRYDSPDQLNKGWVVKIRDDSDKECQGMELTFHFKKRDAWVEAVEGYVKWKQQS